MKQYGLIGYSLRHSFSKNYFREKFQKENIPDCDYGLFPLSEIGEFPNLLEKMNFYGLNVTFPYKEKIMPYLDGLDSEAEAVGAVNTIHFNRKGNSLYLKGFNTDVIGFRQSLLPHLNDRHDRALIFGSGGAAKAVAHVLKSLSVDFLFVSRNPKQKRQIAYAEIEDSTLKSHRLLINCTPLGTFPKPEEMIPIEVGAIGAEHLVYDLVYHPERTKLIRQAAKQGAKTLNGLQMLKLQADASWKIWNLKN